MLRIKQLVFSEGLTLAGARRRLEETTPRTPAEERQEVAEVLDALASDARTRIAHVRDGLRSILQMLSASPGTVVVVDVPSSANGRAKAAGNRARRCRRGTRCAAKACANEAVAQKAMAKAVAHGEGRSEGQGGAQGRGEETAAAPSAASSAKLRDVAQPGSAPDWGSGGRRFESCHPDQTQLLR